VNLTFKDHLPGLLNCFMHPIAHSMTNGSTPASKPSRPAPVVSGALPTAVVASCPSAANSTGCLASFIPQPPPQYVQNFFDHGTIGV
jgi:hypothetical protein